MTDKQIYDLAQHDLMDHPVWYFPMDDSVEDELTVRPVTDERDLQGDYQIIIRTTFITVNGGENIGYLYWGQPESIENLKPVMYAGSGCITFWNGIVKPSFSDYSDLSTNLKDAFPIKFSSENIYNFSTISGELKGLYYIDESDEIKCIVE